MMDEKTARKFAKELADWLPHWEKEESVDYEQAFYEDILNGDIEEYRESNEELFEKYGL